MTLLTYAVLAHNTATQSENKIHDNDVAQRFGFRGGLVPGVDVFAYLCHLPAERWGTEWLERGRIDASFRQPVYEGERISVEAETGGSRLALDALNPAGVQCAVGSAALPHQSEDPPDPDEVPTAPLPDNRPPASPESLAPGTRLGSLEFGFRADRAAEYLGDIRESLPVFARPGLAHPGWLLRSANFVLGANVALGPWIHTASDVALYGLVSDGQRLSTRARVLDEYQRRGHRFVELDVLVVASASTPVMRVRHTAIYEPRSAAGARRVASDDPAPD